MGENMGFEESGKKILEGLGFQKIRRPQHLTQFMSYDFNAEKDGIKYSIEIKTTFIKWGVYSVDRREVCEMAQQLALKKRIPLLLLVDESTSSEEWSENKIAYFLFHIQRFGFGIYDYDETGKPILPLSARELKR